MPSLAAASMAWALLKAIAAAAPRGGHAASDGSPPAFASNAHGAFIRFG